MLRRVIELAVSPGPALSPACGWCRGSSPRGPRIRCWWPDVSEVDRVRAPGENAVHRNRELRAVLGAATMIPTRQRVNRVVLVASSGPLDTCAVDRACLAVCWVPEVSR